MSFSLTLVRQGEYHPATVTALAAPSPRNLPHLLGSMATGHFGSTLYCLEAKGETMAARWYVKSNSPRELAEGTSRRRLSILTVLFAGLRLVRNGR